MTATAERHAGDQAELPTGERPGEDQQRPHRDDEHRQGRRRASFRHVRAVIKQGGSEVPRIRADAGDNADGEWGPGSHLRHGPRPHSSISQDLGHPCHRGSPLLRFQHANEARRG